VKIFLSGVMSSSGTCIGRRVSLQARARSTGGANGSFEMWRGNARDSQEIKLPGVL
jgi:hypothetical protein